MNLRELKKRVSDRLNLSSPDALLRIEAELNDRLREVTSGVNLAQARRGNFDFVTAAGSEFVTGVNCLKVLSLYDPTVLKRPLVEVSVDQIRRRDAGKQVSGVPEVWALYSADARSVTLMLWPKPDAIRTIKSDSILPGVELIEPDDEPAFVEDFHDILVHGVLADELMKKEKYRASDAEEQKFEKRLSELRYFYVKSAYLGLKQVDRLAVGLRAKVWPYSNLA